ncbi:MAG: hypothetical protein LBJ90_06385, partial [Treponema sp.]|nr:hypothetical protein [Treponema sp.]
AKHGAIEKFLIQDIAEKSSLAETLSGLAEISGLPIPAEERNEGLSGTPDSGGAARDPSSAGAAPSGVPAGPAGPAEGEAVPANAAPFNTVASLFSSIPGAGPPFSENMN